ncbi:MAG TPA: S8 family serine peptidase [Thermoanaerobaculia bacterium]|nr:S8 family serine peptidase [Thermoanaerobaculia bacterium]
MKRIVACLIISSLSGLSLFAADAPTRHYLVATRDSVSARRMVQELRPEVGTDAGISEFKSVAGFAAELSDDEVANLRKNQEVRFVELDPERYLDGIAPCQRSFEDFNLFYGEGATRPTLNETRNFQGQTTPYGISLVNAQKVWSVARGRGIKVGVIDTGIDTGHPDLMPNYAGGIDLANFRDFPTDKKGHGSHVSGTIGGVDNDFGVVGVAPEASIYAIRVFNDAGSIIHASDLIKALDYANANKLNVVNLSLGGPEYSALEETAFQSASEGGLLIFAAAGNDGNSNVSYPAGYKTVVAVSAIDSKYELASFSTFGPDIMLTAPGVRVISTVPRGLGGLLINTTGTTYAGSLMDHASRTLVEGSFVSCDLGKPGDFPAAVNGKIALIKRGDIPFGDKVKNAVAAGATAAIIYNKEPGSFNGTLCGEPCKDTFAFPLAAAISQEDGEALRTLPAGTSVKLGFDDYDTYDGTSMACPHAVGVAALVWSVNPSATAADVRDALLTTARDLGQTGWDPQFGFGVVDAYAAARKLAPQKFPIPPHSHGARR